MQSLEIIQTIQNLFSGADERNWKKVRSAFADQVWLDYSSMTQAPASLVNADDIIQSWAGFLPGFDSTHHQLAKYEINCSGNMASATYTGNANHIIGDKNWTVIGDYETQLELVDNRWVITSQKFNFSEQIGDVSLPEKAVANISKA